MRKSDSKRASSSDGARFDVKRLGRFALKAPIHVYRWTLKPYVGWQCRHLPTCSEYGLEAIDRNGAWRGGWLTASRLCRCRPGGTQGFDPVPDIRAVRYRFTPWRYGRWTGAHLVDPAPIGAPDTSDLGSGRGCSGCSDDDSAARSI